MMRIRYQFLFITLILMHTVCPMNENNKMALATILNQGVVSLASANPDDKLPFFWFYFGKGNQLLFACKKCHFTGNSQEALTAHTHYHKPSIHEHTCYICEQAFHYPYGLRKHLEKNHNCSNPYVTWSRKKNVRAPHHTVSNYPPLPPLITAHGQDIQSLILPLAQFKNQLATVPALTQKYKNLTFTDQTPSPFITYPCHYCNNTYQRPWDRAEHENREHKNNNT